jgi:hypothetical protein
VSEKNPWGPRQLLDENPWSLFSDIALSREYARIAQVVWFTGCLLVLGWRLPNSVAVVFAWLVGFFSIRYITCRLRGVVAKFWSSRVPPVNSSSSFQHRLAGDLVHLVLLSAAVAELLFGPNAFAALFAE